ncbi:MAG: hypothetical protein JXB88_17510 [Spirochaetales bacterium]|nr:hypothetical protein [Spirochaetales bacterium]
MPILQVKNCPESIYKKIRMVAKAENRSISQQTLVLIEESLHLRKSNKKRRKILINKIARRILPEKVKEIDPVLLIREDRDR